MSPRAVIPSSPLKKWQLGDPMGELGSGFDKFPQSGIFPKGRRQV